MELYRRTRLLSAAAVFAGLALGAAAPAAADPALVITSDTTLTADSGPIIVAGDGTTLDCAGHQITGTAIVGINVLANHVTVMNCRVQGFDVGIQTSGDATRILANAMTGNDQGIRLAGATNGQTSGNTATSNRSWGIIAAEGATGNAIVGNTANNNALIGIALNTTFANLVSGNSANHNGETGVDLLLSSQNVVRDNVAAQNGNLGFHFFNYSNDNTIVGNRSMNNGTPGNGCGFCFNNSSRNTVSGNVAIHSGGVGFFAFFQSEYNVFSGNRACQSFYVDAADIGTGAGNTWINNNFCTSQV